MARAVKRWQPIPRKPTLCQVQEQGKRGFCGVPVVKGQDYCEHHLRRRDRVKK